MSNLELDLHHLLCDRLINEIVRANLSKQQPEDKEENALREIAQTETAK